MPPDKPTTPNQNQPAETPPAATEAPPVAPDDVFDIDPATPVPQGEVAPSESAERFEVPQRDQSPFAIRDDPDAGVDDTLARQFEAAEQQHGAFPEDHASPESNENPQQESSQGAENDATGSDSSAKPPKGDDKGTAATSSSLTAEQLAVAQRAQLDIETVEAMPAEHRQTLLDALSGQQARHDEAWAQRPDPQAEPKETAPGAEDSGGTDTSVEPTRQGEPAAIDLDAAVQPFEEVWGAEAASAMKETLSKVVDALKPSQPPQEPQQQQPAVDEQTRRQVGMLQMENARMRLERQFPQLADDASFGQVQERMKVLLPSGRYQTPIGLMQAAAEWCFQGEGAAQQREIRTETQADDARSAGSPMTSELVPVPTSASEDPDTELHAAMLNAERKHGIS